MKSILLLLNIVQFVVILVITNPNELAHKKCILDTVQKSTSSGTSIDSIARIVEAASAINAEYHNYWLFSVSTQGGKTVTKGMLGKVIWTGDAAQQQK